jgi:crotonobetainyl-CoA:carnitine CoA-transferase CaiB-like acyl-CoA transferase
MSAPLDGIIVVSLEQAISAPFASRQLADLGATVIKVERPTGDFARHYDALVKGNSAFFVWANRGKQSVTVDMADPEQVGMLRGLIAGADVFLHNVAAASAERHHLDATSVRASHPGLIACEISGYGSGGPRSGDKAYDLAIQAEAGAFSVTGDEEMSKVGFSVADIAAGMYALSSILAALVRRERTGEGATIAVSMLESLAEWMSAPMYAAVYGTGQAPRTGRRHHAIAPYGTFRLSDGSTVLIAVQNDAEWQAMAGTVLGMPHLGKDSRFASNASRIANVDVLERIVSQVLAELPADVATTSLHEARVAVARVNDLQGLWEHEQLRARGRFHGVRTEHGRVEMLDPPFDIDGLGDPQDSIPAIDEHDPALIRDIIERGRR